MGNDNENISSSSTTTTIPWTLHDYMSLGEVEQGLCMSNTVASETQDDGESTRTKHQLEEIQRLPMLLRLLSTTRNLVSCSILNNTTENDETKGEGDDPLVSRTVERLEHVAAIHSVAEGIDVVTCYLAPSMTRRLSRVPPLEKRRNGMLDTTELEQVARDPKGPVVVTSSGGGKHSRKRAKGMEGEDVAKGESDDNNEGDFSDDDEEDDDADMDDAEESVEAGKKRKRPAAARSNVIPRRTSLEVAAEDSQEAMVVKTLSELASLVATSLEPIVTHHDDHGDHHHHDDHPDGGPSDGRGDASHQPALGRGGLKGQLALTIDDSILAETGRDGTGGAMELSDLGSTVVAILHHAPVLRSRHVANALCRASIPQVANLMTRMGANCPASVASLLLGCIQAYQMATLHQNTPIANVAKQGVLALAKLSPRETGRVIHKLQSSGIMYDVQLELAIQEPVLNPMAAANLLVKQIILSTCNTAASSIDPSVKSLRLERQQSAGEEAVDDFRKLGPDDDGPGAASLEPTLPSFLLKRPVLYQKALDFLVTQFQRMSQMKRLPRGQLVLFLKAYCCLLFVACPPKTAKFNRSKCVYETALPLLQTLTDKILEMVLQMGEKDELPPTSSMDSLVEHLYCAFLMSSARIFQGLGEDEKAVETCQELNILLGELPCQSRRLQGFRQCLDAAIAEELPAVVHAQVAVVVASHIVGSEVVPLTETFDDMESGLQQVCTLLKPLSPVEPLEDGAVRDLASTVSSLMIRMDHPGNDDVKSILTTTLQTLLVSDKVLILPNLESDLMARFVSKASQRLFCGAAEESLMVPLVLSPSLERHGSMLLAATAELKEGGAKFLLQLLHVFEYLDAKPKSPFALDPRSVPLKEALKASLLLHDQHFLSTRLYELTHKHCIDVILQLERAQILAIGSAGGSVFHAMSRQKAVESFYSILRSYVLRIDKDAEACGSENLFIQAKASLCDSDLCTTVCSAFLASPHKPKPIFTYHVICRDPLVLFKCSLKIWKCRGLRRIAISVLSSLLESNAILVRETSPLESAAEEFLAARNVMVVRCLLMCISGLESDVGPSDCTMVSSFIRSVISGQEGMVAALIKQGLSERAVDWLVEYVPECMNDSREMLQLLSDRSPLTAAERLVAADTVLRIAIVHGQSQDEEAASLVHAALAQLIDSFFLVVGPVGVPVNALIVDDSGLDVTQISRKAAFRILKSLTRVRGRRTAVRKECGIALQKLASLCKSESAVAGVAGAVAGRRKTLLKEMFDLITKAATTMESSFGNQPNTTSSQ